MVIFRTKICRSRLVRLLGDGSQYFEFVVTDLVNPLCFEAVELGFIDCDTICELTNLVVETGACTGK